MAALLTAGITSELRLVTSPAMTGRTTTLTAFYGVDGVSVTSGAMAEGAPGVYSINLLLDHPGIYWALVSVDGAQTTMLVRVRPQNAEHVVRDELITIGVVLPAAAASVQIMAYDGEGNFVGSDETDNPIAWPQAATQVPGRPNSWYYEDVRFPNAMRALVRGVPGSGIEGTDTVVVVGTDVSVTGYIEGWVPTGAVIPADWISLSRLKRHTGFHTVDDQILRDLREMAIASFVEYTGVFAAAVEGTHYGIRAQGPMLHLPMPIVLPHRGGLDPVMYEVERFDQTEALPVFTSELAWRVTGPHASAPSVLTDGSFSEHMFYRLTATWGLHTPGKVPPSLHGVLAGLVRWHSLAYGVGPDQAADKGRLGRETSEGSRDRRVTHDGSAIGMGLTGFRDIDRELNRIRVDPPPWVHKCGNP